MIEEFLKILKQSKLQACSSARHPGVSDLLQGNVQGTYIIQTELRGEINPDTSWGCTYFSYVCWSDLGTFPDALEKPNLFLFSTMENVTE